MEGKIISRNTKIQLSLASVMFFSPFVKSLLRKDHLDIGEEEKSLVLGYIRLGYIIWGIMIIVISSAIFSYLFPNLILERVYQISVRILLGALVLGSGSAIAEVKILQGDSKGIIIEEVKTNKSDILFSYLPVYNIFLWYKIHNFEHPYWRAKESIILRTLFLIVAIIFQNPILSSFVLVIIIIRVASLMSGIDVLDNTVKEKINKLFQKNPEEMWCYISATIKYFFNRIFSDYKSFDEIFKNETIKYSNLIQIQKDYNWLQYTVAIVLLLLWFYWSDFWNYANRIFVITSFLVIGRYVVMFTKRKHLPNIPIAKEISEIIFFIIKKIKIYKIKFVNEKTKTN